MPGLRKRGRGDAGPGKLFFLFSLMIFPLTVGVAWGSSYEAPKDRRTAEVLPANQISGPHFRVRELVVADGYMFRFTVDSDYGTFPVGGLYGLRKLIREIQAIAALREVRKAQAVLAGARDKGRETVEFAANLLVDPAGTVAGLPQGVGKLFSNIAQGLQNPDDPRRNTVAQDLLKVSDAKRKIAYDMGVDVYSSNRVLQDELDSVGRAQALGALGVSAAIPYGGGAAVSLGTMSRTAGEVSRLLRDESPNGLRNLNEQKLLAMGVDRGLTARFLSHTVFTPRHDTVIVNCLERLSGARGREEFIRFALAADDEESANFFQNMAEILRYYHETVSPIREISVPGVLCARAANEAVLVPFPLDYGVWSLRAERVVGETTARQRREGRRPARIELWVTGTLSPLAREKLQAQGITVLENVHRRVPMMD